MSSCREDEGGAPKCKLGILGCKSVEIRGTSFDNIYRSIQAERNAAQPLPVSLEGKYDVMIIGEAPGRDEDLRGLPFQGQAGSTKLVPFLKKSGLDLSRVWVTNLVRCRPPRNRRPTVQEIGTCQPYLEAEIKLIKPKVIVLLGNSTLRIFNLHNQGGINTVRGKVYEKKLPSWKDGPVFNVIPTIHPAALLHRPNKQLERRIQDDYSEAYRIINGDKPKSHYTPEWTLIKDIDQLKSIVHTIKERGIFAFDTESPSLEWWKYPMMCLSLAWGSRGECAILPFLQHDPNSEPLKLKPAWAYINSDVKNIVTDLFEDPSIEKIAHNLKYDANVLRKALGCRIKGFLYDTQAMHHLLDELPPHDLETLSDIELCTGDYGYSVRCIVGHGKKKRCTYDNIPDDVLWPYASTDAESTFRLKEVYHAGLLAKPHLWKVYLEETYPQIPPLAQAEWFGHKIDLDVREALEKELEQKQINLLSQMRAITKPDFNPLSNPQLKEAFVNLGYGDKITDRNTASGFSANKNVLMQIQDDVPLAGQVLEYRHNRKMISTYLKNVANDVDEYNRVRYNWMQHGTVSGRLSCRFFHQIPKIDESRAQAGLPVMRDMFVVEPGFSYVSADYSQVELWILAIVSEDKELLRILKNKEDLHKETASLFLGIPPDRVDKFNRAEVGKRINFGLAYGSTGWSLVHTGKWRDENEVERNFTWDMINDGMARWKARFTGVSHYIETSPDQARINGGVIQNAFGRERRLGAKLTSDNKAEVSATEREVINFPIQSNAGALTNRTMGLVHATLEAVFRDNSYISESDIRLINTVHDSLAYEVRDEYVDWFIRVLRQVGERPVPELDNYSFPMDIGVGKTWTEAEMKS